MAKKSIDVANGTLINIMGFSWDDFLTLLILKTSLRGLYHLKGKFKGNQG